MRYKGYTAKLEYDSDNGVFNGTVLNFRTDIAFQGETLMEAERAFHKIIDKFLVWCDAENSSADVPIR